jgi:hypothetical protein
MTKKHLAEQILQVVDNALDEREQLDGIIALLDTLEPKNIGQFAKWGHPEQKSTPENCWK